MSEQGRKRVKPLQVLDALKPSEAWAGTPKDLDEVERLDWELLLMFFLVTLVLLITFILNHEPGILEPVDWVLKPVEIEVFVDGLSVLVLLFSLYVFQKHKQLASVRRRLIQSQTQQEGLALKLGLVEALFEVSSGSAVQAGERELFGGVLETVRRLFGADAAWIWATEPAREGLILRAVAGDPGHRTGERIGSGAGLAGWVVRQAAPLLLDETASNEPLERLSGLEEELRTGLFVPMMAEGKVFGVLGVGAHAVPRTFDDVDRKLLQVFANNLAASVAANDLIDELQRTLRRVEDQQIQLVQAEKLAGLGELMAGISHELNNPLAVVTGHAELLLMDGSLEKTVCERLEKMRGEAHRAKRLVESLLRVARGEAARCEPSDLNTVVAQSIALLQFLLDQNQVRLELELADGLPAISLDPFQVQQLIFNLVNNARQAMMEVPAGARHLQVATLFEPQALLSDGSKERAVLLRIRDTGPGIHPDHLGRIFDPFFTTRLADGGTGLGLSICHRIVQEHHGAIKVANHPEGGALFEILFPANGGLPRPVPEPVATEPLPRAGRPSGRVMVVDDELGVRELLEEMLRIAGHSIVLVCNGREALEALASDPEPDVIVLDLKMPVMDGQQFFERLKVEHPRLVARTLFLTGDTLSREARAFLASSGQPCLSKPFTYEELCSGVDALMGGSD
jgi:signal transduction histidine kinase/CheY-like chemotaxis protein